MKALVIISLLTLAGVSGAAGADPALDQRIETAVGKIEAQVADVPVIQAAALRAELQSATPPILLDARSAPETAISTLPGAVFDRAQIKAGARVVVYCTVGLRSGKLARELRARGVDAVNLRGGILAWLAAGGMVVDAAGKPTRRVHTYGSAWNLVPADVEAVW